MIVVIPSNRRIELSYLAPLIDSGVRFIVVDDSEGTISIDHPSFEIYNWGHRRKMLGPLDEHFPRRNGACRSFGFYRAWHDSDSTTIAASIMRISSSRSSARCRARRGPWPAPPASISTSSISTGTAIPGCFPAAFPIACACPIKARASKARSRSR